MAESEERRRDAAWIEREYGTEKWPAIVQMIEEEIAAAKPGESPARIVGRFMRRWRYAGRGGSLEQVEAIVDGTRVHVPLSVLFGSYAHLIADAVLDRCTPETDLVLELGAGPGHNLMAVWLRGGPAGATYVSAEFTEAGRRAAELLAALDPALRLRSLPFDYHAPDLSGLSGFRHAVVFTAHSIEQIPHLPAELFGAIRGVAESISAIHFEPVGWQLGAAHTQGRREGSSRAYAEEHDYNRNFVELLREQERAGTLTIERLQPEVLGEPNNGTTIVEWHSSGR
jgi:hypothetical protein